MTWWCRLLGAGLQGIGLGLLLALAMFMLLGSTSGADLIFRYQGF